MKTNNSQTFEGRWTVALDIGGTHVSAAAVDLVAGRIIEGSVASLDVNSQGQAESILAAWSQAAAHALALGPDRAALAGVGLAMPGPFDYERGICLIEGVGKYESLFGLNIRTFLKERLQLPPAVPVLFRNDAVCFLLGEAQWGAARGWRNVIAITLGTGFGSAFLRSGEVVDSGPGVPPGGWFYTAPWKGDIAENHFSTRGLVRRYAEAGGTALDGAKDMAARAAAGEDCARQTFDVFGRDLGDFLAPWAAAMPADMIVVGGNISRAWEWFGPAINDALNAAVPSVIVQPSVLLEDAALLGAASLPMRYREPKD